MYKYKISVIIPVYNVERYLRRCLDSVFAQTFDDFEVICINDCSPDNSINILEEYEQKHPDNMRILNNLKNMGLGATRDHGLAEANGKYIAFIDSDDCIKSDYLMTFYNQIIKGDYDMVSGGYIIMSGDKEKVLHHKHDKHSAWLWPSAWAKLYKHSFLLQNKLDFRGTRIYEDEPFTYRVMFNKPKFSSIEYCGYYYVMNEGSITQSKNSDRSSKFYTYIESTRALVKESSSLKLDEYEKNIFEFSIMSGLIANALFNGQSSGSDTMCDIHKKCFELMDEFFPNYMKNPYFHLFKLPQLEFKKRYCTWLIIFARRFHMDKPLFKLVGNLKK